MQIMISHVSKQLIIYCMNNHTPSAPGMALRWFNSIGGNIDHNLKYFCLLAAAVREDSEQHNAHHGKAWHQVQAPEWATSLSSNDTNVTNINQLHSIHLMTTKNRRHGKRSSSNDTNDTNWDRLVSFESFDDKKERNNRS